MSDRSTPIALPPAQHERSDASYRAILLLLAFILVVLLMMLGLAYWMFPSQLADRRFATPFPTFPTPALQADPAADMATFRAQQLHTLDSLGWTDKPEGKVHIPIAQAMAKLAAQGIPGWPTTPGPARR